MTAREDDDPRCCGHCGAVLERPQRCGRCRAAWYCDRACQRAAWSAHRAECGASTAAAAAPEPEPAIDESDEDARAARFFRNASAARQRLQRSTASMQARREQTCDRLGVSTAEMGSWVAEHQALMERGGLASQDELASGLVANAGLEGLVSDSMVESLLQTEVRRGDGPGGEGPEA